MFPGGETACPIRWRGFDLIFNTWSAPPSRRYLVALLATCVAFAITLSQTPVVTRNPFILFAGSVAVAAWYGGLWPGMLAVLASMVGAAALILVQSPQFGWEGAGRLLLLGSVSTIIVLLAESWRRAQTKAQRSEQSFQLLVENARDYAIFRCDLQGRIESWNIGAEHILGYREEEIIGKDGAIFFTPEDRAKHVSEREIEKAIQDGRASDNRWHMRKNGERFWANGAMIALRDRHGEVQGLAKIMRDFTMHKLEENRIQQRAARLERRVSDRTRELRESQEQVHQLQKLDAIGRLAGGIAHDFNNIITGVLGAAESLRDAFDPEDPRRGDVQDIVHSVTRAGALTRQLLAFSRRQTAAPIVLNLNSAVHDMERMLRRLITEDIELSTELEPNLGRIKADPAQMEQVIVNIVVNAREAMPKGGRLLLRTENTELDAAFAQAHPGSRPGSFIVLTISDSGIGMDAETKAKIFEPFFTTKQEGTGLGLATVYGIVQQNGGYISVESQVGEGTTFKIYWPRAEAVEMVRQVSRPAVVQAPPGSLERILVVEDEALVRKVMTRTLQRAGYAVLEAANGSEALDLARETHERIDLLLTDIVMPGLNGRQLAELLLRDHPEMAVLYTSGYTADVIATRGLLEPDIAFIEKSFTSESLQRKVREVLDNARQQGTTAPR